MRARRGVYTMPNAITTLVSDGPSAATSEMASRMSGKAIMASITRETILSAERKKPATRPARCPARWTAPPPKPTVSDTAVDHAAEYVAAEIVGAEPCAAPGA